MNEIVEILIKARDATAGAFRSARGRLANFGRTAGRTLASVGRIAGQVALGLTAMATASAAAAAKVIGDHANHIRQQMKLAAVLKATGYAAGFTRSQLNEEANALQELTGISNDTVTSTQAILATFKEIRGDEFKRATIAILDMSTVLDQDAKQGAIQLGKALNDPIRGVTALQRVGVSFTQAQKNMIRAMTEANDIIGAQQIILRELETEFGGAAKAVGDELPGAIEKAKQTWSDFRKEAGRVLDETFNLQGLLEKLRKAIKDLAESGKLQMWAEDAKKALQELLPVAKAVVAGLGNVWKHVRGATRMVAAGAGTLAGGGSLQDAWANMKKEVEAQVRGEQEREQRLAKIRADMAAKRKAQADKEQEEMDKAGPAHRVDQTPVEKKNEFDAEKAAKMAADVKRRELANELNEFEKAARREEAIKLQAEEKAGAIRERLDETKEQRIERKRADRQEKRDADRIERLQGRADRGARLSSRERAILEEAKHRKIAAEAAAREAIERNNAEARRHAETEMREKQAAADLAAIREKLTALLQLK